MGASIDVVNNDKSNGLKIDSTISGVAAGKSSAGTPVGNVTLSPMSAQLQKLEAAVKSSNVFDIEKVDAIKTAISAGQFQVNTAKVAAGLIATVTDLLTTQKS